MHKRDGHSHTVPLRLRSNKYFLESNWTTEAHVGRGLKMVLFLTH